MMHWEEMDPPFFFKEGDMLTYATNEGIFIGAEIVKVQCQICMEEFVGNKKFAGLFLSGHLEYHKYVDEYAEYHGGT